MKIRELLFQESIDLNVNVSTKNEAVDYLVDLMKKVAIYPTKNCTKRQY